MTKRPSPVPAGPPAAHTGHEAWTRRSAVLVAGGEAIAVHDVRFTRMDDPGRRDHRGSAWSLELADGSGYRESWLIIRVTFRHGRTADTPGALQMGSPSHQDLLCRLGFGS